MDKKINPEPNTQQQSNEDQGLKIKKVFKEDSQNEIEMK
jgi:hypothetical protein